MKYNESKKNGNLVFSKDAHIFDKGILQYCTCFVWSFSCSCKQFLVQEADWIFCGLRTWSWAQCCWRIQLILVAMSLLGVLASQDIQGDYSGKGLVVEKHFWAWWSQGMRFDNLSFKSWVSARTQQHSNSNFGLFFTFLRIFVKGKHNCW